jgi:hypothetical protein
MTPILGILASGISGNLFTPSQSFDSIATATVSTPVSSITFSSIPQGYRHLQIRGISRIDTGGTSSGRQIMRINGDSGSNYDFHGLYSDGSTAGSEASVGNTFIHLTSAVLDGNTANVFQGCVVDILDYADTNKNKTTRTLYGNDFNGSGEANFYSGLWMSTSAITSLTIYARSTLTPLFKQYSTFALYGVK